MRFQPQIIGDSYRVRGPLLMYPPELLNDPFGEGSDAEENRVPFSPASNPDHPPAFPKISRREFYQTLSERTNDPSKIHQRGSSLCGPASLLYLTGLHYPSRYSNFLAQLYEEGAASLGALRVEPGEDCRNYDPAGKIAGADWVGLAGIRDSENWLFDYDEVEDAFAGITMPGTLAKWLGKAGFANIQEETNILFCKGEDNLREADAEFRAGRNVCLLVNATGIENVATGRSIIPNHWVVLTSPIVFNGPNLKFSIFTWGEGKYAIPQGGGSIYPTKDFLNYYYGYIACG